MKHTFGVIFAVFAFISVSYIAIAADNPIAAKDLPVIPSKPTTATATSAANESTQPVTAIDDAINKPAKSIILNNAGEYSTETINIDKTIEKQISAKKKVTTQKKAVRTAKRPSEYRKKFNRKKYSTYTKRKKQPTTEKDPVSAVDGSFSK